MKPLRRDNAQRLGPRNKERNVDAKTLQRFLAKVDRDHVGQGCWFWRGGLSGGGYARWRPTTGAPGEMVHRLAYKHFIGPIPGHLVLDHLCRVRNCCNPWHLEAVTMRENILRGMGLSAINARRTHCKHGHPFDTLNTSIKPDGARRCKACCANRQRLYRRRWRCG